MFLGSLVTIDTNLTVFEVGEGFSSHDQALPAASSILGGFPTKSADTAEKTPATHPMSDINASIVCRVAPGSGHLVKLQ